MKGNLILIRNVMNFCGMKKQAKVRSLTNPILYLIYYQPVLIRYYYILGAMLHPKR
jgi:hypothetical protein